MEEKRQATPEEQDTLALYTGFGNTKIDFSSDHQYFLDRMGEKDKERYHAVKAATERIEKASSALSADELSKFGLTAPVKSNALRRSLQDSMLTAFYTDQHIALPMWNCLEQLGFKGGTILDPSSGNGRFFSSMPQGLAHRSSLHMVEIDPLTAMVASLLHPEARTVNSPYEDFSRSNKADAIITNQPFSTIKVVDGEWMREGRMQQPQYKAAASQLTSYYPVKMMENLNPGGVMAVLTTSQFFDAKHHASTRQMLASEARFVGGVRLPLNTFPNADVQSDILIFQKFAVGEKHEQHLQFTGTQEKANPYYEGYGDGRTIDLNEYFATHPENIIGTEQKGFLNRKYQPVYDSELTPEEIGREVQLRVNTIIGQYKAIHTVKEISGEAPAQATVPTHANDPVVTDEKLQRKIEAYGKVRESLNALLKAYETDDPSQVELRRNLDRDYNLFAKDFKHIGDKKNVVDLQDQPEFAKVAAIEKWRPKGPRSMEYVGKADLFRMNTIHPVANDIKSTNPQDIINHSFHKHNRIVPELLEEKLGADWQEKTRGLIYLNPSTRQYEPANYYLGGDVKTKLDEAREVAKYDSRFLDNVSALESVQPERIEIKDISINFGANFVPAETYSAYIKEQVFHDKNLDDRAFSIGYNGSSIGSSYSIRMTDYLKHDKTLCFGKTGRGTASKNAEDIIEAALQDNHVVINFPKEDKDDPTVQDVNSTFAANSKIDEIRDGFVTWLSQPHNAKYAKEIEDIYNNKYNRTAPIRYDAGFVEPVGCTLQLRPHQKSAVARILTGADTLVDHPVGYGKTAVMIAGIQEQHRLGLAQKSLLLCMKANVKQIAQEYQKMYPGANILFPTETDFAAKNRNVLLNKIKTNKYDCVILTHDQYGLLTHSKEVQEELLQQKLNEYTSAIDANPERNSPTVKDLTKKRQKIEQDLKELAAKPHDPLAFEELGFDKLYVDESHQFKNLSFITTHNNVAGLGTPAGSIKATKLLMGVRHIQQVNGGDRGVVFATGTPITNSIVEAYNIMQFLRPSMLKEHNHQSFDAWASQYAKKSEELEVQPSMAIKRVDRFREFVNIPEVQKDYLSFADVPDPKGVSFDKPQENKVAVTVPSGGETHMQILRELKQLTETGSSPFLGIQLSDDKFSAKSLVATTAGAKEAISSRFLGIEPTDPESDKATAIARNIAETYRKTDPHKGVQLVFSEIVGPGKAEVYDDDEDGEKKMKADAIANWKFENFKDKYSKEDKAQCLKDLTDSGLDISKNFLDQHWTDDQDRNLDEDSRTAKIAGLATRGAEEKPYNLFADIKDQLVKKYGIPEDEIVSIRDYSPARRKEFFDKANSGEVRVLMGSTQTLGTGVNVQSHVVAMHHADVPWTPAAVEQRSGRGVRQGNEVAKLYGNKVDNMFYLKEKSADAKKYNLLDIKQTFINSFKDGSNTARTMDTKEQSAESFFRDCLDETLGNPLFRERNNLVGRREILQKERTAFNSQTLTLSADLTRCQMMVDSHRDNENKWRDERDYLLRNAPEKVDGKFPVQMRVNGSEYTTAKEAGDAIFRSTAIGNKTVVEAYGYRFNVIPSSEPGKEKTDRVIQVSDRLGEDASNLLPFSELHTKARGFFSLGNLQHNPDGSVAQNSSASNVHIALAVRGIADDIEGMATKFQQQKVQMQNQVNQLNQEVSQRKTFPKAQELLQIENRINEIDKQLNGDSSLDLKNWRQLSEKWDGREGNAELITPGSPLNIHQVKDQLFSKFLDLSHEEGVVRNSLDMQKYQFQKFEGVGATGRDVELAGPLTVSSERIKAILPKEYLQTATQAQQDRDVSSLKDYFVNQVLSTIVEPLREKGGNPHVVLVESPDATVRDLASDSAKKNNPLREQVEANNPVMVISGTDNINYVHSLKDVQVDFFQVKTSFTEFATNAFTAELEKEDFCLNPSALVSAYEQQASVAHTLKNTLGQSEFKHSVEGSAFPDNFTFTLLSGTDRITDDAVFNSQQALSFHVPTSELHTLVSGSDAPNPVSSSEDEKTVHTNSLSEVYTKFIHAPQNADASVDSENARKFLADFSRLSSYIEQERYIAGIAQKAPAAGVGEMDGNQLFSLLNSSVTDLAERHPSADGHLHLLATTDGSRIMPDPYYYAGSAETFPGLNQKVTIPEKEALRAQHPQDLSVWSTPAEGATADAFFKACAREGIRPTVELMDPKEKAERAACVSQSASMELGSAKLFKDYSFSRPGYTPPQRLTITFSEGAQAKVADLNKQMDNALVGLYRQKGSDDNSSLLVYPLAAKPSHDKAGNEIELVAMADFPKARAERESTITITPSFVLEAKKNSISVAEDIHVAGQLLNEADRQNLKTLGQMDRPLLLTSPAGNTRSVLLYADTNRLFPNIVELHSYDPSSLKINEEKRQSLGLGDEQIRLLKDGKSVECTVGGSKAYLLINPKDGVVSALSEKPGFALQPEHAVKAEAQQPGKDFKDYSLDPDAESNASRKQSL